MKTPYYLIDQRALIRNLEILKSVSEQTGCKILLAQKAFSMFSLYPLIGKYLDGTVASGLYEAKLGYKEMGKENHVFSAAYSEDEFDEILEICGHIVFNSFNQWEKYRAKSLKSGKKLGMRINPELSTQNHAIYDPCSPFSRLGVTQKSFRDDLLEGLTGFHFHTLCQQNSGALIETLASVEEKFGKYIKNAEWVNFGGGHHITRDGYDITALIDAVKKFKEKYDVEVYLEPGEAVALNAGFLLATVLDIVDNGMKIAILDVSAACHMPDVLEMPYRPEVVLLPGASEDGMENSPPAAIGDLIVKYACEGAPSGIHKYTYRLAGHTCLAGDIIGDYSFGKPLEIGQTLCFKDMAIYTMVKNNTFNGMKLPSIVLEEDGGIRRLIREFTYEDFKNRLS